MMVRSLGMFNEQAVQLLAELEQKNIGIEQVMQVLPTILRVKTLMPELISEIAS